VTTVPDIPVVHIPALEGASSAESDASMPSHVGPSHVSWAAVEVPRGRRLSPVVLATLGVVAGIGAMVLGAAAVVSAGRSHPTSSSAHATEVVASGAAPATPVVERRVLALLAKPSTERIVFSRRLVLAVGAGGRAAILIRGLERAAPGRPYRAWILTPGRAPARAAQFVGTERAVFLSTPVSPRSSVAVSAERPVGKSARSGLLAARG
jgi:hypothetical protein